jgi:hypothetical protein
MNNTANSFWRRLSHKGRVLLFLLGAFMTPFVHAGCGTEKKTPDANAPKSISQTQTVMKIRLKLEETVLTATLNDSKTARDFAAQFPLTLTLTDYSKTEKISDLPRKLSTDGAPSGSDPSVGDIAYYAPWGNLAIFYRDFGYSSGLVILGKIDGGIEALNGPKPVRVTIEVVSTP